MSTIKDVARLAGVSYTTVSHVLNQTRPVSPEARERVLQAVKDLDYVPSALARSLRSKVTGSIGLIIPNNTNPYFSELARGIEDHCYGAGYSVILCNSDDDPDKQRDYLLVLQTKRCDGLIIATLNQSHLQPTGRLDIPTVLLDLKYSRDIEREADDYAIGMFQANGLPRQKLALVFEKLEQKTGTDGSVSPYLSSHPANEERIAHILDAR